MNNPLVITLDPDYTESNNKITYDNLLMTRGHFEYNNQYYGVSYPENGNTEVYDCESLLFVVNSKAIDFDKLSMLMSVYKIGFNQGIQVGSNRVQNDIKRALGIK